MKNVFRILMNTFTYVALVCFNISVMIVAYVVMKETLARFLLFKEQKHPELIDWILWGGFIFVIFVTQQITYPLYKKHIHLKK